MNLCCSYPVMGYDISSKGERNMKRKLLILSILAICISMLAVGSLAYFNSEDAAHNVITTGSVKIEVQEWADAEKKTPFEDMEGIMPDMSVTKIAEVKNIGASDAWIRVKVSKAIELAEDGTPDNSLVVLDLNTESWVERDGYLYYNKSVKPDEVTEPVFTTVRFDKSMGNEYRNASIRVNVEAEAVQTANNGDSALTAQGWPTGGSK